MIPGLSLRRGKAAESLACDYLKQRGLKLVAKNFRCKLGELDLIMRDGDTLVFVEVKFRHNARFGHASETVDHYKQAKLIRAAQVYLQQTPEVSQLATRFDVVSIEGSPQRIEWLENAFDAT